MEEKKVSFSVQMTVKELFRFKIYHVYHRFSGVLGVLLSVFSFVMLIGFFSDLSEQMRAVFALVAVWFVGIDPLRFYFHARTQVKKNPVYRQPLCYEMDEQGIVVSQGEQKQQITWKQCTKIVETGHQILIYTGPMYAFIFPKQQMEQQIEAIRNCITQGTKNTGVRWKTTHNK